MSKQKTEITPLRTAFNAAIPQILKTLKQFCKEDGIPASSATRVVRALQKGELVELNQSDLFLLYDALGCSERDQTTEWIYQLAGFLHHYRICMES